MATDRDASDDDALTEDLRQIHEHYTWSVNSAVARDHLDAVEDLSSSHFLEAARLLFGR